MKRALDFATKLNSRDIQKCHWFWVPSYDLFASARKTVVNLSRDVFERRTSTGSGFFSFSDSGFAHLLGQLVSIIVKTLRNTNLGASRCFKMKKTSLPVDVRRSKTPLLKLPSISRANGERRSQIEKHVVVSVRSNLPLKISTVLSEPKFGPPQSKIPGNASCLYPRRRYSIRRQKRKRKAKLHTMAIPQTR